MPITATPIAMPNSAAVSFTAAALPDFSTGCAPMARAALRPAVGARGGGYSPLGDGSFDLLDLEVFAGRDVAWCHAMIAIVDLRCRLTLGLRRVDGQWMIAREHHSFPGEAPAG